MRIHTIWNRAIVAGLASAACVMVAESAQAVDEFSYVFTPTQVTNAGTGNADQVVISSGGSMAFVSSQDGNPEIYLKDIWSSRITQVTATASPRVSANPQVGEDGLTLFFQSNADLVAGKNTDLSVETFRRDGTSTLRQLTSDQSSGPFTLPSPSPATRVSGASVTDDGSIIVYSSTVNCAGVKGNPEIFLYDLVMEQCFQVTNTPSGSNLHPVIDAYASTLAFVTNATSGTFGDSTFTITNPDGNFEVMEVGIELVFIDPCTADPSLPECDPCSLDPFAPECDLCAIDPSAPGCVLNTAPTISVTPSSSLTVDEGKQAKFTITVTDPEGDMVALRATQGDGSPLSNMGATFTVDRTGCDPSYEDCSCNVSTTDCYFQEITATVSWTPTTGKGGRDYQIALTVTDTGYPDAATASEVLLISVTKVNHAPTISVSPVLPSSETFKATSKKRTYTITGSDADCDTLNLQQLSLPSGATLSSPTATACSGTATASKISAVVEWTPDTPSSTQQTLSVKVSDPGGLSATATGKFTVVANQAPKFTLTSATVVEGSSIRVIVKATDPDGDPLLYDADPSTPLPPGSTYKPLALEFNWLPWFGMAGGTTSQDYHVKFRASDCPGGPGTDGASCTTTTADLKITVTYYNPNKAYFTSSSSTATVAPGGTATFSITGINSGTSTWTAADGIALAPKNVTLGLTPPAPVPVTQTVLPGQYFTLQANVTAPAKTGVYYISWQMTKNGVTFSSSSSYTVLYVQ